MEHLPTHFIPSFFQVTPSGRDIITSQFQNQFPDVFVGYEDKLNAFFIVTNDQNAISTLIGIFAAQIKIAQSGKFSNIPQSPKVLPLDHTTVLRSPADNLTSPAQITRDAIKPLVDLECDSEDSSEDTSSSGDLSVYWSPENGNIDILHRELATSIANLTGCIFCPEPEHRRVRLVSGNIKAALEKLNCLEVLMIKLSKGASKNPCVDYNILSLSCQQKSTAVSYTPTVKVPHAERIMVENSLRDQIELMLIGEEHLYDQVTGKYGRAPNLGLMQMKEDSAVLSEIWSTFLLPKLGNPENAKPNVVSQHCSRNSTVEVSEMNENMGLVEQARVREWSKNIDTGADPTQAFGGPTVSESEVDEPITTRVVIKSDSDEEEEEEDAGTQILIKRNVAPISDDEDEEPSLLNASPLPPLQKPYKMQLTSDHHIDRTVVTSRTDRVSRRPTQPPSVVGVTGSTNTPITYVAADTFFADVPRDVGEFSPGVGNNVAQPEQSSKAFDSNKSTEFEPSKARTRRGFGYDGTSSEAHKEIPEVQVHGHTAERAGTSLQTEPSFQRLEADSAYKISDRFDSEQYGSSRSAKDKNDVRRYLTHQDNFTISTNQQKPIPTWPRPSGRATFEVSEQRIESPQDRSEQTQRQLIDYASSDQNKPSRVMPPPGFSASSQPFGETSRLRYLLDEPLDDIQRPSIKPQWATSPIRAHDDPSESLSSPSSERNPFQNCLVQTKINKPDLVNIRSDMVSQLLAARQPKKGKGQAHSRSERIDTEDEVSTRKFHNTMNLKAPNSGRGKKSKGKAQSTLSPETAAQRNTRIANAKAELGVGVNQPMSKLQQARPTNSATEKLSKKSQEIAKVNQQMGSLHTDSMQALHRKKVAGDLNEQLEQPFSVARLFPGHLEFEIQIGQLCVTKSPRIRPNVAYDQEKWNSIFNKDANSPEVFFTDLLTTSGSEIDEILNMKEQGVKVWSKGSPGPSSVIFEFDCQDSTGSDFHIHFNVDGTFSMCKDIFTIHQIGVHCPGRTWDACAVVRGNLLWHDIPEDLQKSIGELISSIAMAQGRTGNIYFRTPSDNSLTVRDVRVKRTSRHNSQLPGETDLQLKIVETKRLYMTANKKDNRLIKCIEKDHDIMAREERAHFKVALVHTGIIADLKKNEELEAGNATLADSQISALTLDRVSSITSSALRFVDKIDWVGGYNTGTIPQRLWLKQQRTEEVARSLPVGFSDHNFIRPAHLPSGMTIAGPRSTMGAHTMVGSTTGYSTQQSVHGIRSGTTAQTFTDGRGNYFKIGLGGARIPLDIQEEPDGIAPDDSASQVGPFRQFSQRPEDKPDSFW